MIAPPPPLIEALQARYAEPHRAYHTWGHVEALIALMEANRGLLRDPMRVLWAIYWHDAIYDPKAHDNEARSAHLLRMDTEGLIADAKIVQIETLILATAKHELPQGVGFDLSADCGVFLDFDLSILAAPEAEFDAYEAGVRKEYEFVPEEAFRAARAGILQRFLARERLYFSPVLARSWEGRARANLQRSLRKLAESPSTES